MAVVKLKLISVNGDQAAYADTMLACISEPEFHMDDAGEIMAARGRQISVVQSETNPYSPVLSEIDAVASAAGIKTDGTVNLNAPDGMSGGKMPSTDEERLKFLDDARIKADTWDKELKSLAGERDQIAERIHEDERIVGQLVHIKETSADLDKIFACEFFRFRFGHMPRESYDNLSTYTADLNEMFFYASSVEKKEVWGLYFTPKTKADRIDALFESLHFERVRISERAHGTPAEAITTLGSEIESDKKRLADAEKALDDYKNNIKDDLVEKRTILAKLDRVFDLRKKVMHTKDGFILAGYVTASHADDLKKKLEAIPGVTCTLENAKTTGAAEPPTKLRNPGFLGGFEDFVKMYGLPSYNEMDPTPLVAITYFLFFGMMFGDVGQGAVIILVGALMWFLKKMSLGKVLMTVGVSSIIFGFFYGSVFGMEDLIHGFNPSENINTVLIAAVAIGAIMIILVILMNIINGIRQKDPGKIFFSQNGLAGLIMYAGAVILVLAMLGYVKFAAPTWLLVTLIILALAVIFLREPLTRLVEGRKNTEPESVLDFVLENFFELFEVVLSFLTNTISFIRIGAFALSHVGMMSVVFLLAQTSTGYNPVILVIGNLFVIGFEGMIVCIQVLRLEFYELFGRFYEGNGRPFEPAGEVTKE